MKNRDSFILFRTIIFLGFLLSHLQLLGQDKSVLAQSNYYKAEEAYNVGEYNKAIKFLEKAEGYAGTNHLIQYLKVKSLYMNGDYIESRNALAAFFDIIDPSLKNSSQYKEMVLLVADIEEAIEAALRRKVELDRIKRLQEERENKKKILFKEIENSHSFDDVQQLLKRNPGIKINPEVQKLIESNNLAWFQYDKVIPLAEIKGKYWTMSDIYNKGDKGKYFTYSVAEHLCASKEGFHVPSEDEVREFTAYTYGFKYTGNLNFTSYRNKDLTLKGRQFLEEFFGAKPEATFWISGEGDKALYVRIDRTKKGYKIFIERTKKTNYISIRCVK